MTSNSITSSFDEASFLDTEASYASLTSTYCSTLVVASDDNNGTTRCRSTQVCHNNWGRYLFPRTKATIMVLLWMFLIFILNGLRETTTLYRIPHSLNYRELYRGADMIVMLCIPVAGFLADAYWGRFRLIIFGLLTWWLLLVAVWIGIIFISTVGTDNLFPLLVYMVPACMLAVVAMFVGLPGFLANIIQFGIDQLPYASSDEINIYIHWIVWAMLLGMAMGYAIVPITLTGLSQLTVMGLLVVITAAIVLVSIQGRHWFHTEYTRMNLYSLIWKVLNFARKNKTPVSRSALTYCENDPPSRIDLGKTKYGGPFTTEQVEDVKTFLRIFGLVLTTGPYFALNYVLFDIPTGSFSVNECLQFYYYSALVTYVTEAIVIPINILVIYPMCRNYYPGALKRMGLAMVLVLIAVLVKLIFTLVSIRTIQYQPEEFVNCTWSTVFQNASHRGEVFIPAILTGTSFAIFYPAIFGLISAQSPQNMMGILIGVLIVTRGLFILIGNAFVLPELILGSTSSYEWVTFLICLVFGVGGLFLFTAVARLYKFRERDEEPKDQLYVESYYDKIIK